MTVSSAGYGDFLQLIEQELFLAFARARGEQYRPPLPVQLPPGAAQLELFGRWRGLELEIPGYADAVRAERSESLRIFRALRRDAGNSAERLARQLREPPVARRRFLRQSRIDEIERDAALAARADQIGPDLGFHQDADTRLEMIEKIRLTAPGRSYGQIAARDPPAEERPPRFASGGRHVGEQHEVVADTC